MSFSWVPLRACRGWTSPKTEWETPDRQSRNTRFKRPTGSSVLSQGLSKSQGSAFLWGLTLPSGTMGGTVKDGNRGNPSRQSSRDTSYFACRRIRPRIKPFYVQCRREDRGGPSRPNCAPHSLSDCWLRYSPRNDFSYGARATPRSVTIAVT